MLAHVLQARNGEQYQTLLFQPHSLLLISCSQEMCLSEDTLLTVGGWKAVSQANVLTVLQHSICISGFGFATDNSPACSWQMTSVEVLQAEG